MPKFSAKVKKQQYRKVASDRAASSALEMAEKEGVINIFAKVEKSLGDRRFQIQLSHKKGQAAIGKLRGVLRGKAVRIEVNDIVVVAQRESDKVEKYDICGKLEAKDIRKLRKGGLLGHLEDEAAFEFDGADPQAEAETEHHTDSEEDSPSEDEKEIDIDNI